MSHKTKIAGQVELPDGQVAVAFVCCDVHEHWHTMWPEVINDPEKLASSIEWAHKEAAKQHELRLRGMAKLEELKAQMGEVEHP